jgi:thiamine biosynthesis lipoprotein
MTDEKNIDRPISLQQRADICVGRFSAMASPCEVLLDTADKHLATEMVDIAANEAWRIEQKFSRYRSDNIISQINSSNGKAISVDAETAHLLGFAYQCYQLSDGLFDISSGILRKVWNFDGSNTLPSAADVKALLPLVGLDKANWSPPLFSLPEGMQIDFGGIGKEYSVDRTLMLLQNHHDIPVLVNFGGDIMTNRCRPNNPWLIGVEDPSKIDSPAELLEVCSGGLATSGGTRRCIIHGGKRFSHVLNPLTGWPVENPPISVTVAAENCTLAGMLATYAMLQGSDAESFLDEQDVAYWCMRL